MRMLPEHSHGLELARPADAPHGNSGLNPRLQAVQHFLGQPEAKKP